MWIGHWTLICRLIVVALTLTIHSRTYFTNRFKDIMKKVRIKGKLITTRWCIQGTKYRIMLWIVIWGGVHLISIRMGSSRSAIIVRTTDIMIGLLTRSTITYRLEILRKPWSSRPVLIRRYRMILMIRFSRLTTTTTIITSTTRTIQWIVIW